MEKNIKEIIDNLAVTHRASPSDLKALILEEDISSLEYLRDKADKARREIYKNTVYIRGLIEFTNYCKNDCYYCGIRRSNEKATRYRLSEKEILTSCHLGHDLGFRTFVLQGGEDAYWNDRKMCHLVSLIREEFPDSAITLSLGERSRESYEKLYLAGANRYLLRHETATKNHYNLLHPKDLTLENRIKCLKYLKEIGYETGCGFMVGSPYQDVSHLVADLLFIKEFQPEMVGIGPFIPASNTPFENEPKGSTKLTLKLLSIIRLLLPNVLLPATTALGTADENGRQLGILAGANVIMPNLSPSYAREKYNLYNNKIHQGLEAAEGIELLRASMEEIGFQIVTNRGDCLK